MQYVDVKVHENIATILLSRAVTCNALNPQLISDLMTALSDVHQEKRVRAVVLAGTGAHFCSGLDLTVLGEIASLPEAQAQSQWFTLWSDLTRLYEEILRFPKPVIAAVDGAAMGAGFALALAADCVVASTTASFAANAVHRGMVGRDRGAADVSRRCGGRGANAVDRPNHRCDRGLSLEPLWATGSQRPGLGGGGRTGQEHRWWATAGGSSHQTTAERRHRRNLVDPTGRRRGSQRHLLYHRSDPAEPARIPGPRLTVGQPNSAISRAW